MKKILFYLSITLPFVAFSQTLTTHFEKTNGTETATYFQTIAFYKALDKASPKIIMQKMGPTDAGKNLHLVLFSANENFNPDNWHRQKKVVILINNGIHPGEPDGIDATMMLMRDLAMGKIIVPKNLCIATIPIYNIGGSLNRNQYSRVNQNGPLQFGFRGNSQNLDLNRDFTKCDSKEAQSFTQIFHYLHPEILIDNHVSDGADYQHTITLLTTQYNKLGSLLGSFLKTEFEPALYAGMHQKGWDMCPYVNFESTDIKAGMEQFYDPPRYSSGYAALWGCIGFVPETHMLKPFKDRVNSTYHFLQTVVEQASINAEELIAAKSNQIMRNMAEKTVPLNWEVDTSLFTTIRFKGYEQAFKTSDVTGMQRMYYNHNKPFETDVHFFNEYKPKQTVALPKAYIIPQGWHNVIALLKMNKVIMQPFDKDTMIAVQAYRIEDYKSLPRPYEKHHKNNNVVLSASTLSIQFLKGDYLIYLNQNANRYLVEMLEPTGDDGFFSWNFFDAILQQKEGYSDYRWEDVAADFIKNNPNLKTELDKKKQADTAFAASAAAQLNWVYKRSPYYEPAHLRYPVYRLLQ